MQNVPITTYNKTRKQYALYCIADEYKHFIGFYNTVAQAIYAFRIEQYKLYR